MSSLYFNYGGKMDRYPDLYRDQLYHIYNRTNGSEKLFYTHENYLYFLKQFDKYLSESLDTFCFCLLPNHFHILARIRNDDPNIVSKQFRSFFISYSMSINIQQERHGSLFQRGFKRKLINNERYFFAAVYYIHANPVHHNILNDLSEYKYSSYRILRENKNTKLCRDELYSWFGGIKNFISYHEEQRSNCFSEEFMIEG